MTAYENRYCYFTREELEHELRSLRHDAHIFVEPEIPFTSEKTTGIDELLNRGWEALKRGDHNACRGQLLRAFNLIMDRPLLGTDACCGGSS
jgi:hypothetical protein